jgi:hypothetical protein
MSVKFNKDRYIELCEKYALGDSPSKESISLYRKQKALELHPDRRKPDERSYYDDQLKIVNADIDYILEFLGEYQKVNISEAEKKRNEAEEKRKEEIQREKEDKRQKVREKYKIIVGNFFLSDPKFVLVYENHLNWCEINRPSVAEAKSEWEKRFELYKYMPIFDSEIKKYINELNTINDKSIFASIDDVIRKIDILKKEIKLLPVLLDEGDIARYISTRCEIFKIKINNSKIVEYNSLNVLIANIEKNVAEIETCEKGILALRNRSKTRKTDGFSEDVNNGISRGISIGSFGGIIGSIIGGIIGGVSANRSEEAKMSEEKQKIDELEVRCGILKRDKELLEKNKELSLREIARWEELYGNICMLNENGS